MNKSFGIDFNAPVILTMTAASFVVVIIGMLTGGGFSMQLAVWFSAWSDPMMYLRMFTHILPHMGLAHYTGNFLLILVVGPLVEEKYGSLSLALMVVLTAFVTGFINVVFFRNIALMGASGIAFMLILLASFSNIRSGRIPLTFILVSVLYLGGEIYDAVTVTDNVSHLSHIIGGICGALFGFVVNKDRISGTM